METNRLNQFYTLYRTGNFRKAAEILGISHSGLSKSMATLENEIEQKLFMPSGRGIVFTDEGHNLAIKIPDFLQSLNSLISYKENEDNKVLKIGSFEVFTTYFSKLLGPMLNEYKLEFHELVPGKMERALLNKEIDIAITYEPIPLPNIEHLKVTEIEMGVFVKKGSFNRINTLDIPFAAPLIPMEGSPTGTKGLDSWPDDKFKRNILYRVDLMETAISLTRNGLCAVFIPIFVANLHNQICKAEYQLVKKSLPDKMKAVKRKVFIVKRASSIEDSKVKKIAKFLRSI